MVLYMYETNSFGKYNTELGLIINTVAKKNAINIGLIIPYSIYKQEAVSSIIGF